MPPSGKKDRGTERPGRPVRVLLQPSGLRVSVPSGDDLASAARRAGVPLGGVCGGAGTCGRCRVLLVGRKGRRPVLACTLRPDRPVTVVVPEEASTGAAQILTEGVYVDVRPRPSVHMTVEEGRPVLSAGGAKIPLRSPLRRCLGVALDLGTTTLVASLFDLSTGRRLAVAASLDPQVALGEDVVSRINLSVSDREAPARLRSILLKEANRLVREACASAGVSAGWVCDVVAVGNTFMHHSFLGLPVGTLAESPYTPATARERELPAAAAGLRTHRLGRAFLPPPVAGFLGSDAVAGALAAGLDRAGGPTLYIDLGTNGELLLAFDGRILGATTAAGPAFEGAQIECGMRGAEGAISAVHLVEKAQGAGRKAQGKGEGARRRVQEWRGGGTDGSGIRSALAPPTLRLAPSSLAPRALRPAPSYELAIETIGAKPARGIAGSGLVDAVAALLDAGAVDRRGNMVEPHPLVERDPGGKLAVLCRRPHRIHLSQHDIRSLQLAKAAVAAGTVVLLDNAGITGEEVELVLLAGAFGNFLDRRSAVRIGLLPPVGPDRVLGLGNAASTGAGMMLLSADERKRALELTKRIEYIELAGNDRFRELFVDCLAFP
ncbi:MAG: DUF4445 domain-containing protein [Euryarchaeota archaeon]|nr:DUF4445 domain-containing protein [Euryarchaeota archaeon]